MKSEHRSSSFSFLKNNNDLTQIKKKIEIKKNQLLFEFSLSVSINEIKKLFTTIAKKKSLFFTFFTFFIHFSFLFIRGYHIFLEENNEIIIYRENRNSFRNILKFLLTCAFYINQAALIKIKVKTDMTFCKRIIELTGLKGVNNFLFK